MNGTNTLRKRILIGTTTRKWFVGVLTLSMLIGLGATQDESSEKASEAGSTPVLVEDAKTVQIFVSQTTLGNQLGNPENEELAFGSVIIGYTLPSGQIKIRMLDGESCSVSLDGKVLPEDRYRTEKGHLFLLDNQGGIMDSLRLFPAWKRGSFPGRRLNRLHRAMSFSVTENVQGQFAWVTNVTAMDASFNPPPVMLGFFTQETSPALEKHLNLEPKATVMISGLFKTLAADQAGLEIFDIIQSVDGEFPVSRRLIMESIIEKQPGEEVSFGVIQGGTEIMVSVTVEAYDRDRMQSTEFVGRYPYGRPRRPRFENDMIRFSPDELRGILVVPGQDVIFTLPVSESPILNGEIQLLLTEFEKTSNAVIYELELKNDPGSQIEVKKEVAEKQ